MQSYIDVKYVNLISPYLQQFKRKGDFLWNFRCPYCGDSQKSRTKARGFVYRKKNDLFYKCHNCGVGTTLGKLIEHLDSKTYKDYIMERYKSGVQTLTKKPEFKFDEPIFNKNKSSDGNRVERNYESIIKGLKSISQLQHDHPARQIVEQRRLPRSSYEDLFLCPEFYKYTNSLIPNKFPSLDGDHPRLLIPFRDEEGEVFAYQGRAFGNEQPKYLTIKLKEQDKIFGMDRIDKRKEVFVVEGPLDSLFIDNCIAVAGADVPSLDCDVTVVFDNEPRNKELLKQIEKTIKQGHRICLWPEDLRWKDINDMIIAGYEKKQIQEIIKENTFSGTEAQLKFVTWRKINAQ
tara:strand:- start:371 stop:1411 length:1041 start_codon:yes stop_codon:yes gene_type:complete